MAADPFKVHDAIGMLRRGMPPVAVAAETGLARSTVGKIERGEITSELVKCHTCGGWVLPPCVLCAGREKPNVS